MKAATFHLPLNSRAKASGALCTVRTAHPTVIIINVKARNAPLEHLFSSSALNLVLSSNPNSFCTLSLANFLMRVLLQMWKPFWCRFLLIITLAQFAFAEDPQGNPANEIVNLINQNRTAIKLPKLLNSRGLGCMALQYLSQCTANCTINNTLNCHPSETDITEIFAPNCGVELPTVGNVSTEIIGCNWEYHNPNEAFSEVLISDKKELSILHGKEHTEVGVGLRRVKKGAYFWCILFSSGNTSTSFVLEDGGRGIEQKSGCFSGEDQVCSGGMKVMVLQGMVCFGVVIVVYGLVFGF